MSAMEIIFSSVSVCMGLFLLFLSRSMLKRDKREEAMLKGMRLVLRGVKKTGQLSYATAMAVQGNKINGEMETAMDGYKEYMDDLDEHLENQAFQK